MLCFFFTEEAIEHTDDKISIIQDVIDMMANIIDLENAGLTGGTSGKSNLNHTWLLNGPIPLGKQSCSNVDSVSYQPSQH